MINGIRTSSGDSPEWWDTRRDISGPTELAADHAKTAVLMDMAM